MGDIQKPSANLCGDEKRKMQKQMKSRERFYSSGKLRE